MIVVTLHTDEVGAEEIRREIEHLPQDHIVITSEKVNLMPIGS